MIPSCSARKLPRKILAHLHAIVDHSSVYSRTFLRFAAGLLLLLIGWQLGVMHERGGSRLSIGGPGRTSIITPGLTASGITVQNPRRDVDISLVWDVWDELTKHYIDPEKLQVTPLVYGAAEGLARAVGDPYTVFMSPKETEDFRSGLAGDLEGIGAELTVREGAIIVVSPIKGSPAERAGIFPKDIIEQVDGESTEGWSLNQAVNHIRGKKGTQVKIGVARLVGVHEEHKDFTITRAEIHVPSVESHTITSGSKTFGYVALNQFGEGSINELTKELRQFKAKNVDGIILDLRNNGGGYLDGAVDLVSLFKEEGAIVTVQRRQGDDEVEEVSGHALLPETPLVLVVNEGSASASEIVAGALQDYGRATIVGKKTFGKGTVQEVVELRGGSSLRVTIARWLTPKGKNLGKEGVHPDIDVEPKKPTDTLPPVDAPWTWKDDPQLAAAVDVLLGKKK